MPDSLSIGAFAFGAVLVLTALAGGQIKLFGAEVNARLDRSVRVVAFVLGAALLGWALLSGHGGSSLPPSDEDKGARDRSAPNVEAAAVVDLSGQWIDNHGGSHQISQRGQRLRFVGYNEHAGVSSRGTGRVDGDRVTWDFQTDIPSTGKARLTLAPDGNSASGVVEDSAEGRYALVLTREP